MTDSPASKTSSPLPRHPRGRRARFDVFMLDWGVPGDEDKDLSLSHLLTHYLPRATRKASRATGGKPLTLLGYCIGGTLTACYTALYPAAPVPVKNMLLFTTPLDFAQAGYFGLWTRRGVYPVEELTESLPV